MNRQLKIKDGRVTSRGIEWVGGIQDNPAEGWYPWRLPTGKTVYLAPNGYTSNPIRGQGFIILDKRDNLASW